MQCQSGKTNTTATGLFRAIMAKEGLRGLYRGVLPPVYSMAAVNAYLFAVEGAFSRAFGKRGQIDKVKCSLQISIDSTPVVNMYLIPKYNSKDMVQQDVLYPVLWLAQPRNVSYTFDLPSVFFRSFCQMIRD